MLIQTYCCAFAGGKQRVVEVPDAEWPDGEGAQLEEVFRHGQNDFQPMPLPSLSVGDVVQLGEKLFRIGSVGFRELEPGEGALYRLGDAARLAGMGWGVP